MSIAWMRLSFARLPLAIAAIGGFIAVATLPEPAAAQNFPPGSWRQSCKDARMEGRDDLVAECRRRDGSWNRSRIDIDRCGRNGSVGNDNGRLVCENTNYGNDNRLPPGSWSQSCRNARIEGRDDLVADCRRRDGGYNRSSLDLDRCGRNGRVANDNGRLVCENANAGGGNWWGNSPPQGSYRQSCRNERMEGRDLLVAECRRQNGNFRNTRLDIDSCRGRDIANNNGHLECGGRGYGGNYGSYGLPGGSWRQSCRDARIVRDEMIAECRARDGQWRRTDIDLDECKGREIVNENGKLNCSGRSQSSNWDNRYPPGSWQQSCRNPRFQDGRFFADCRRRDGGYQTDGIDLDNCRGQPVRNEDGKLRC